MVPLSDLSSDKALQEYTRNELVKVQVLDVNIEKERVSLGIKQLANAPLTKPAVKQGDVVRVTVVGVQSSGVSTIMENGIKGFIPKKELDMDRALQTPHRHSPGEEIEAKITKFDADLQQLRLSLKAKVLDAIKVREASIRRES